MNSPLIRTLSNTTQQFQQLLSQCTTLTHLQQTHTFILKHALFQNDINLSRFIHRTASLNFPTYSYSIFTFNHNRPFPIFVYNNIIYALSSSNPKLAVSIFSSVRKVGLSFDSYSLPYVLKSVVCLNDVGLGKQIHCVGVVTGLDKNVNVVSSLIQMYSCCGGENDVCSARKVFDWFGGNGCVWNAMIVAYVKVGDVCNARKLFDSMSERDNDVFTWTAMISGYTQVMF